MTMREFTLEEVEDADIKLRKSVGSGRWSEHFEIVFEFEGKNYLVHTEEGLTEYQDYYGLDCYPDHDYETELIPCEEVELYTEQVPVTKWRKL